jgi:hypothetical protein
MKLELTIKTDYLPKWQLFEGLRELIGNGRDAQVENHAPLTVRHKANTLFIENEGATLPHEALLFGHTTKVGRGELIGKFGEGLKLGVLALVRAGHAVKIRSGSEVWIPKIERSEKFNADVLVFYIETGRLAKDRVQIEVSNIPREAWELIKPCFLFLGTTQTSEYRIDTSHGALLLSEKDQGKVFVKGVFVENDPKLKFGYDLTSDVDLDRDRRMIARWDLEWRMRSIWQESVAARHELMNKFFTAVENNAADVGGFDAGNAGNLPDAVRQHAVQAFKARHGEQAFPVDNLADSQDLEHMGKKGVLVNKPLKAILQSILGSTEQIKASLANEVVKFYGWHDLSEEERTSLEGAIALVNAVEPTAMDSVDVVDFRSPTILGMYQREGNRIQLSKVNLSNQSLTLEIMVHEVAHRFGVDGSHSHVAAIERIWSMIVAGLRGFSNLTAK